MVVQTLGNQAYHLVFALGQLRKGSTTAPFGRARGSINVSYGALGYRIRARLRTTIRRHDTARFLRAEQLVRAKLVPGPMPQVALGKQHARPPGQQPRQRRQSTHARKLRPRNTRRDHQARGGQ